LYVVPKVALTRLVDTFLPNEKMRLIHTVRRLQNAEVALVFVVSALLCAAQTLSPGEIRITSRPYFPQSPIRVQTRMVELEVVVRDSHGRPVPGLTKDDFMVYDAHKPRDITSFFVAASSAPPNESPKVAKEAAAPQAAPAPLSTAQTVPSDRSIALFFDDFNTPTGDLARAKTGATRFIKEASTRGDRIALFTASGGVILNFTSDTAAILAAIAHVEAHPRMSSSNMGTCPRITPYEAYRIVAEDPMVTDLKVEEACHQCGAADTPCAWFTSMVLAQANQTWDQARVDSQATLDAIKATLVQLARMPGRHMLLIASSGFMSETLDQQLDGIINVAVREGIVINSLDAKGLYAEAPGTPLNETVESVESSLKIMILQIESLGDRLMSEDSAMARFAESTGGLLFQNNNDLDLGFYRLGVMPSVVYLLGFPPAEDGVYHKIKVELRNASHISIHTRPGYFAPTNSQANEPVPADTIDSQIRGSVEKTGVPATIIEKFGVSASGSPLLTIQTHVDIQKLTFQQQKDRQVQMLTFVAALYDPQGKFVTGKEAEMSLALKPESFDYFSKTGINGVMQLEAPRGAYRFRMVIQEAVHGNMSATSKNLQIP